MTATDITLPVLGGARVLVVDADSDSAAALTAMLRLHGFDANSAETVAEAFVLSSANHPHVVVVDPDFPDIECHKIVRRLRAGNDAPAVVVLTGDTDTQTQQAALKAGAVAFLLKPAEPNELVKLIQSLSDCRAA